ncbi:S-layer homology domain-containing protein [Gracilibacillus ureilyticus]|uniref:S-layer homology domain-containing protein n=1 Tax=Gracilibacillus ureilyticus TaxID=531814 RepID=A0A1H9UM45_9BACI|nr:S-layer homology domain-containing protein [Gracilibacillus ureilyticus]SES10526.1 S-layer homology domain-containing protein [Gracilibacillus ureilyticus]
MAISKKSKVFATSLTAAVAASAVVPSVAAASLPDVPNTHYAADHINALVEAGIITGYEDGTFRPERQVERAEAAVMLSKILGYDADSATSAGFTDVAADAWYANYVNVLANDGVIAGFEDNTFKPSDSLTRAEFATLVVQAYGIEIEEADHPFTDVPADEWYTPYIETLYANNLIAGKTETSFAPEANIERADFAMLLANADYAFGDTLQKPLANGVEQIAAVNNTTVEVDFEAAVSDVDSIDFSIEGLDVTNAVVKQTDASVVILTTSAQEGGEEYTVSANGEELGTFEGISSVVPDEISFVEYSNQSKVGDEITLRADIGVEEAGVPVTFNIDAPTGSLNEDQLVEVYTNEDGIAEYSYTQYAADTDTVSVYPTGAPQVRALSKVYWGVADILVLEQEESDTTLANGDKKTYKVTFKDPETGEPVDHALLNVSFLENIDVKPSDVVDAVVGDTDNEDGAETPYQTTDNDEAGVIIETDSNGEATFTVSGTNTTVTPVVWLDSAYNEADENDEIKRDLENARLDSTELQTIGNSVTFRGAQETNEFKVEGEDLTVSLGLVSDEDEAAAGSDNGRKYTVTVTDEDGDAYKGGIVNVALNEDIDGLRSTETNAWIGTSDDDPNGDDLLGDVLSGKGEGEIQLKLDDDGKAEFFVFGQDDEVATPIVWIDQNNAQNTQAGYLEEGEPNLVADTTNFEDERVVGAVLGVVGEDETEVELEDGEDLEVEFYGVNQSGNYYDAEYDVTYVVKNTGSEPVVLNDLGVYEDGEGNLINTVDEATIEVGGSLTLHNNDASGVDGFSISGNEGAAVQVTATAVTEDDNVWNTGDDRENNLRIVPEQTIEADFVGDQTSLFTGTVVAIDGTEITIRDVDGVEKTFDYDGDDLFTPESDNEVQQNHFASLLTVGDIVTYTKDSDDNEKFEIIEDNEGNAAPVVEAIATQELVVDGEVLTISADQLATDSDTLTLANPVIVNEGIESTVAIDENGDLAITPGSVEETFTVEVEVSDGVNGAVTAEVEVSVVDEGTVRLSDLSDQGAFASEDVSGFGSFVSIPTAALDGATSASVVTLTTADGTEYTLTYNESNDVFYASGVSAEPSELEAAVVTVN